MIHSAPQRNAATLRKVLAPFSVSHVIAIDSCSLLSRSFSLFFLFVDFIVISDCVFNEKNSYSTRTCWISNNYHHFGATRLVAVISRAPSLHAKLRVPTRVYDVEGGAVFSKNSTFVSFDGAAWTPRLRSPSPIMAPGFIIIAENARLFNYTSRRCNLCTDQTRKSTDIHLEEITIHVGLPGTRFSKLLTSFGKPQASSVYLIQEVFAILAILVYVTK